MGCRFLILAVWMCLLFRTTAWAGEDQPSRVWREPVTGMDFVRIPGGSFPMGSPKGDGDERPVRDVRVDGFWMGRTEVTRGQFRTFVEATGYLTDAEANGAAMVCNPGTAWSWKSRAGHSWRDPGYAQTDDHPVAAITWNDASAFAAWLAERTGRGMRLPTEAQWEYACRAGTGTERFWGEDDRQACRYANSGDEALGLKPAFPCRDGYVFSAPAGSFAPNPFGLHDMLGNVWEWCQDTYAADAYATLPTVNPRHEEGGGRRVLRGGSWYVFPRLVRAGFRNKNDPDRPYANYGFRLVFPQAGQDGLP